MCIECLHQCVNEKKYERLRVWKYATSQESVLVSVCHSVNIFSRLYL
jgi:hypothetical protein